MATRLSHASEATQILVQGSDRTTCQHVGRSLAGQWDNAQLHIMADAGETFPFIRGKGAHTKAPFLDLITVILQDKDMQQLELVFDISTELGRRKPILVVVLGDSYIDDPDLLSMLHKSGSDLVLPLRSFSSRSPEIRDLVVQKWFRP